MGFITEEVLRNPKMHGGSLGFNSLFFSCLRRQVRNFHIITDATKADMSRTYEDAGP